MNKNQTITLTIIAIMIAIFIALLVQITTFGIPELSTISTKSKWDAQNKAGEGGLSSSYAAPHYGYGQ